jgi:hypothetical protein
LVIERHRSTISLFHHFTISPSVHAFLSPDLARRQIGRDPEAVLARPNAIPT